MVKQSKRAVKEDVQDRIMGGIRCAFYKVYDDIELSDTEKEEILAVMMIQTRRVAKLFGIDPDSWHVG